MKVPYYVPWITKTDKSFVLKALNQRWLTNGPFLKKFEKKIQNFLKCKHTSGVGSATQALHLSLRALGVSKGDEVIVPTFTFVASANAALYCNAKPILVDVNSDTFTISPDEIQRKITKKTKAIVVVHYGGQSCDMDKIMTIGKQHGIPIVEDCAHSLGTKFKNNFCGAIGKMGCFSFYPTKVITTGEGGAVTTNDSNIFRTVNLLRSQGMDNSPELREKHSKWKYDILDLGYNYRLDEIRSALGYSQISRINTINKMRKKIANQYNNKLEKINGIVIPKTISEGNHIYHLYTIKVDKHYHLTRDDLFNKLSKNGIGASVQYTPIHELDFYKKNFNIKNSNFPNATKLHSEVLCLPIFPQMTQKQVEKVISVIK
jgi:perosamine synthetase